MICILLTGCGNSRLSEDMYDVGYHLLKNIDISDVVIRQMTSRNETKRPQMKFIKMDLLDLQYDDEFFHVVLDKGTLDAIFTSNDEMVIEKVDKMLNEVSRVLKIGGRYVCLSLAQDYILKKLLDYFQYINWFIRVHTISTPSNASSLPVFVFVFTKTRPAHQVSLMPKIMEIVYDSSEKVTRLNNPDELSDVIKSLQEFAFSKKILETLNPEEEFHIDLWSNESSLDPRFSLTIIDSKIYKAGKFAIFIVPQGREHEWLFCVKEGQRQLAESAGFQRLIIVALNRGHTYESIDKIKEELSSKVMELAQNGVDSAFKAPFLSIGNDIGSRTLVHSGTSSYTGNYVVEDTTMENGEVFRYLIFLKNKNIVQSEARLCEKKVMKSNKKKGKSKISLSVDFSFLSCQHHEAIVAALSLSPKVLNNDVSVLLIGLGGGSLPMFIFSHFPRIYSTVVELDPDIVMIAKKWFGFSENERMNLIVKDGLDFLNESSKTYDIIVFDIDSKDASNALSCPPDAFIDKAILAKVKEMLCRDGLFLLNLVCREKEKKSVVVNNICEIFSVVYKMHIVNVVNEILVSGDLDSTLKLSEVKKNAGKLKDQIIAVNRSSKVDLESHLNNLKIAQ